MSRDDIVFIPSIGRRNVASAPVRARQERALERHKRKRGTIRRLAKARARKRMRTKARRVKAGRKKRSRASMLQRGAGRLAGRAVGTAARGAVSNPIGLAIGAVVAGLVVAGAVTLRLASGRSFENMGEFLNKMLLGDVDDEARAKMATRRQLQADSDLTRINAASDGKNAQIRKLSDDLFRLKLRDEKGASLFREDPRFQSNGIFDMLIIRAQMKFLEYWNGNGGGAAVADLQAKLVELNQRTGRKDAPR